MPLLGQMLHAAYSPYSPRALSVSLLTTRSAANVSGLGQASWCSEGPATAAEAALPEELTQCKHQVCKCMEVTAVQQHASEAVRESSLEVAAKKDPLTRVSTPWVFKPDEETVLTFSQSTRKQKEFASKSCFEIARGCA